MHWTDRIEAANALAQQGEVEAADDAFLDAMRVFPDEQWIHYHYARRAFAAQEWDEAKLRINHYLARFELRPPIAAIAAQTFARLGQEAKAEALLNEANQTFGSKTELLEARARIDEHWHRWDSALAHWQAYVAAVRTGDPQPPASIPSFRYDDFIPIFGYFAGDTLPIVPNVLFWRHLIGDRYRLLSDDDVRWIIQARRPDFLGTYDSIRIPACKADVARLLYLEEHGGIYADMHCTVGALDLFEQLPDVYDRSEACFFSYLSPKNGLGNSIIMAQPGAEVISDALDTVIGNLERHRAAEAGSDEHVPYNIFSLTGPAAIQSVLCAPGTLEVASRHRDRVEIWPIHIRRADTPILPFSRYTYRRKGQHWSERQAIEPLFGA